MFIYRLTLFTICAAGTSLLLAMDAQPLTKLPVEVIEAAANKSQVEALVKELTEAENRVDTIAYITLADQIFEHRFEHGSAFLKGLTKVTTSAECALILAAFYGHDKILNDLIYGDTSIKCCSDLPLELAAGRGHQSIVELLLNAQAPVTFEALMAAISQGHTEIALLLIAHNSELFLKKYRILVSNAPRLTVIPKSELNRYLEETEAHPGAHVLAWQPALTSTTTGFYTLSDDIYGYTARNLGKTEF